MKDDEEEDPSIGSPSTGSAGGALCDRSSVGDPLVCLLSGAAEIAAHMIVSGGHMIVQMKIVGKDKSVINEFLNKLIFGSLAVEK